MRLCRFPFSSTSGVCAAHARFLRAVPGAGDLVTRGTSGEISASTFGPPLPVDRPG